MATTKFGSKLFNCERWRCDFNFYPLPYFRTMPDSDMTLSTLSDVAQLPKFKMAAIETASGGRHLEFR